MAKRKERVHPDSQSHEPARAGGAKVRLVFDTAVPLLYAAVFFLVALSVQHFLFPIGDTGVESDFYGELVTAAQRLERGEFAVANYPYKGPVYSFALFFVHIFVGEWYRSGVVLNLVCAAAVLFLFYRLFLRLFGRWPAFFSMVGISVLFEFFVLSHKASSDMLFLLLCYSTVFLLLSERLSWAGIAASGLLSALAFLTRYNGIFVPVTAVFVFLVINPWRRAWRRRLVAVALHSAVFLAVCSPWFALNVRDTGRLLATRNLENIVQEFYGGERAAQIPEGGFESTLDVVGHDPVYFVGHFMKNIPRHFWLDIRVTIGMWVGVLVLFGMLRLFFVPPDRFQSAFFVFPAAYYLFMCALFHLPRLSIPIVPLYYALASAMLFGDGGGKRFLERLYGGRVWRYIVIAAVAGLLVFQGKRLIEQERYYLARRPLFVRRAADFLKLHARTAGNRERCTVMARKPHIAYYAEMNYQHYPKNFQRAQEFIAYALRHDASYITYSVIEQEHYPYCYFLSELDMMPGVERIFEEQEIVIYHVAEWLNIGKPAGKQLLSGYVQELLEAEKNNDPAGIVSACYDIMGIYAVNGKWYRMEEYIIAGIDAAGRLPDSTESMKHDFVLSLSLSQAYLQQGKHEVGIDLVDRIIERYATSVDTVLLANAYALSAWHCEALDEYGMALERLREAQRLYRSAGSDLQTGIIEKSIKNLEQKR